MIKLERFEVMNIENAIRGMRNPMNSWEKSDSGYDGLPLNQWHYVLGVNDSRLAQKFIKAGSDHRKFMRQIFVSVDIIAPLYWWKEYDTYKVGTTENSCSTMHTIHKKKFEITDFSYERLHACGLDLLREIVELLNQYRDVYNTKGTKDAWYAMIQLLPSSYNQKRTVTLTYENLLNMYYARKNHKLQEWKDFCKWVESLPYAKELITGV